MSVGDLSGDGLPLLEALEKYSDPERWRELDSMKDRGRVLALIEANYANLDSIPGGYFDPYLRLWRELEAAFMSKLRSGDLVAYGYERRHGLKGKPHRIVQRLWNTLVPNYDQSSASGGGMVIVGILIRSSETHYARAERECDELLRRKVSEGAAPRKKESLLEEARQKLGATFSERAFIRSWRRHAPDEWKRGGRKPKHPKPRVDSDR